MKQGAPPLRPESRRRLAAVLLALLIGGCESGTGRPVAANHPSPDPSPELPSPASEAGLRLVGSRLINPRVVDHVFASEAMARQVRTRVIFPPRYTLEPDRRYPLLYLLHGCCSQGRGPESWSESLDIERLSESLDAVLVAPEGGEGGLYSDWYSGGAGGPPRWERFHIHELLPWVDRHLRVRGDRQARRLLGISMGGHGAMAYAARYPDRFAGVAALSPTVDTNLPLGQLVGLGALLDGGDRDAIWGPRDSEELRWRGHNPWDLAANLGSVPIILLRSGDGRAPGALLPGDLAEIVVRDMADSLHAELRRLDIAVDHAVYSPGTHTPEYWRSVLAEVLPRLMAGADGPAVPVPAFDYRSSEPAFTVYGWSLQAEREAAEFLRLKVHGPRRFSLSGSGRVQVTTPPDFAAGATHRIEDDTGALLQEVVAGPDRRLRWVVDLGPSRRIQQFRPGAEPGFLVTRRLAIRPAID